MTGTVKLLSLLRSGPADSQWHDFVAGQLAEGIPGLQRLLFNVVLPVDVRMGSAATPPYVAIIEAWFVDRATADRFAASVRVRGAAVQLYVNPLLIHDSGCRPLPGKIMVTLKGRADLSREQVQLHWRTRHVEVGLIEHGAGDFLRLYIQNHVYDSDQMLGSACDFDGVPEYWVDPADLALVGQDSHVMQAIAADEELFADRTRITTMMVTERELFVAPSAVTGWPVADSPLAHVLRDHE